QTVPLAEEVGEEAEVWRERAAHHFAVDLGRLDRIGSIVADDTDLPKGPGAAAYAVADAGVADLPDKQALLEAGLAAERLARAVELLRRENRVLSALRLLPAGRFPHQVINLN